MKTLCLWIAAVLGFLLARPEASAQDFNKAGRAAFQFLKIGIGARQTGMGEASIAVVRDINTVFWDPAGLAGVASGEASFSYNKWLADLDYMAGAVGFRLGDVGVVGLSYSELSYGDIPEALAVSESGSSDTRTGNTFTGNDLSVGLSFARQFSENLSIGVTAKYLREKLFIYSASTFAFDVGTFYDTQFNGIKFAMSAQNFANSVKFLDVSDRKEGYDIPLLFTIGASIDLIKPVDAFLTAGDAHRLTLALETVNSNDYGERWNIGAEYAFFEFLFLRGGYRFNYDDGNTSFGIGLQKQLGDFNLRLDYSYVSFKYLSSPQRISLTLDF
ncbi:MAG TPA: PorV/PorQ family protein [Bacteroidota bacterium]|nr:PorV/PorQ family protein [Bacteroidota bacterium]